MRPGRHLEHGIRQAVPQIAWSPAGRWSGLNCSGSHQDCREFVWSQLLNRSPSRCARPRVARVSRISARSSGLARRNRFASCAAVTGEPISAKAHSTAATRSARGFGQGDFSDFGLRIADFGLAVAGSFRAGCEGSVFAGAWYSGRSQRMWPAASSAARSAFSATRRRRISASNLRCQAAKIVAKLSPEMSTCSLQRVLKS
jgi:hypothetical protein